MSTPCLTILQDDHGQEIAVLYRHWDGYPMAHGMQLAKFLSGRRLVDGVPPAGSGSTRLVRVTTPEIPFAPGGGAIAAGMTCLAAQIVAFFKEEVGRFYLHPAGFRDFGEEYRYYVSGKLGEEPHVRITESHHGGEVVELFEGPACDAVRWLLTLEEEEWP